MKVLYVYSNCSQKKYNELFDNSNIMILQQAQKYHSLLIEGFHLNNIEITCTSGLPINRSLTKKILIKKKTEFIDGVMYIYYMTLNLPILRQICIFINSFFQTVCYLRKRKDAVVICDILNVANASGALLATKILRKYSIGIVTDVPGILADDSMSKNGKKELKFKLFTLINQFILYRFDSYVFLTSPMNSLINKSSKPFTVMEGHVNVKMKEKRNLLEDKYENKVVLYAGSIKKIYGIKILTEAFINAQIKNSELHIYGTGDFTDELKEICIQNINIKYYGVKPNDYIVNEQVKATLLINPRPTNEEYTKYSFPSKNMEYMVSGTPVLTTKLPGMPREYYPYVYLVEDESIDGLSKALEIILDKSKEELHEKGLKAKEFVLKKKNNIVQSKKILEMIEGKK